MAFMVAGSILVSPSKREQTISLSGEAAARAGSRDLGSLPFDQRSSCTCGGAAAERYGSEAGVRTCAQEASKNAEKHTARAMWLLRILLLLRRVITQT